MIEHKLLISKWVTSKIQKQLSSYSMKEQLLKKA